MSDYRIEAMSCSHCEQVIRETIATVDPLARVKVDLPGHQVSVTSVVPPDKIAQALTAAGYPPVV